MSEYNLKYRSIPDSEEQMLDDLDEIIVKNRILEKTAGKLRIVVSEAFTNAYLHGNCKDAGKSIKIQMQVNKNQIFADIIDEGTGGLIKVQKRKTPEPMAENGRGINLIYHYSSDVRFWENDLGHFIVSITIDREEAMEINS